jgi:hypothetical protein
MHAIFHFNCVVCGAHPQETRFSEFRWPTSQEDVDRLLSALGWIVSNILGLRWINREFEKTLASFKEMLGEDRHCTPLHRFEEGQAVFTTTCPVCQTGPGPREFDRYFCAWNAWHMVDGVQVGNLLYECFQLLKRVRGCGRLCELLETAILDFRMQRCSCGRPTTMVYSEIGCRWCFDAKQEVVREHNSRPSPYFEFVRHLDLSRYLSVDVRSWHAIREALIADRSEDDRQTMHLTSALVGYPTGKWLGRWRRVFAQTDSWPEFWSDLLIDDEEPAIPLSHFEAFRQFESLPREIKDLYPYYNQVVSPDVREVLQDRGLIENGEPDDIAGYLERLPIAKVRAISNALGTGKARSKAQLIDKIVNDATVAQVQERVPELTQGWTKRVLSPFDALPREWYEYQTEKARLLHHFVQNKYFSLCDIRERRRRSIDVSPDCPEYCRARAKEFRRTKVTGINDIPPWFPGCCCMFKP